MYRLALAILAAAGCLGNARADVRFHCPAQLGALETKVSGYLRSLGIPADLVARTADRRTGTLTVTLTTPAGDTHTLDFSKRPGFALSAERVLLPTAGGKPRAVQTVSRKEIVLALLQHGRLLELGDAACSLDALIDHVGVRQNIVAWAENLDWIWPDGGLASWNPKYWRDGKPAPGVALHQAVMDAFLNQEQYAIGCYTAAKLVAMQGVLDYHWRIKRDPRRARRIEAILLADDEPINGIEPGTMWAFEDEFEPRSPNQPGKLLELRSGIAPGNFVPGDWGYLVNTDAASRRRIGYEGSNAIYLGRNRFADFYNDNNHGYSYEQKLDQVYQWRNGVFSQSRDAAKAVPLTPEDLLRLGKPLDQGGMQLDVRATPRFFRFP